VPPELLKPTGSSEAISEFTHPTLCGPEPVPGSASIRFPAVIGRHEMVVPV
jgi:hypothetical protein